MYVKTLLSASAVKTGSAVEDVFINRSANWQHISSVSPLSMGAALEPGQPSRSAAVGSSLRGEGITNR
jgi:hypothetical protein